MKKHVFPRTSFDEAETFWGKSFDCAFFHFFVRYLIGGAVLQQETLLQRDYVKGRFNRDVRRLHFATTQNGPVDPAAVNRRSQMALIGSCPRPACV